MESAASPSIRNARPEDIPLLAFVERSALSLFRQIGLDWIADYETKDPALLSALAEQGTLWVAVDRRDKPVGFLAAHQLEGHLYLAELSVLPSHQRQNIGSRLIETAVSFARQAGYPGVTLTTNCDVAWNAPYYLKRGFREVDAAALGPKHAEEIKVEPEHLPTRRCAMIRTTNP